MLSMLNYIRQHIKKSIEVKQALLSNQSVMNQILVVAKEAIDVYARGNKILVAGNGGSAADAQHIVGELVSRFYFDRPGLPAIALTTDTSILTSVGNDYGYDHVFSRQLQANAVEGDMFIGISTSGNSPSILSAFEACAPKKVIRVGLTGESGGKMNDVCDYCINVPSNETPRIQESHIMIGHILCAIVEEQIFGVGF